MLCQGALPIFMFREFMMRLNLLRVSAVSGKRLTVIGGRGSSSSSSALSPKTDTFGFLCDCVLSKLGQSAVRERVDSMGKQRISEVDEGPQAEVEAGCTKGLADCDSRFPFVLVHASHTCLGPKAETHSHGVSNENEISAMSGTP